MITDAEIEQRLRVLEGPDKLDQRFGVSTFLSLAWLGLFLPIAMIVVGWGLRP